MTKEVNGLLLLIAGAIIGLAPAAAILFLGISAKGLLFAANSAIALGVALVATKHFVSMVGLPVFIGACLALSAFPQYGFPGWIFATIAGVIGFRIARYGATEWRWARYERTKSAQ
jgi:hypothetical protein